MYLTRSEYDRGVNTFSPEGRLFQVEYALEAIKKGSTGIGVRTNEGVFLAVEKRLKSKLLEPSSIKKIVEIDRHVGCAQSGLAADAQTLVDRARVECQQHTFVYDEPMPVRSLTRSICDVALQFGESGKKALMSRPFGVALLLAGCDDIEGPQLFHTDPSGTLVKYLAKAIGSGSEGAQKTLEDDYSADMAMDAAERLALTTLKEAMEEKINNKNIEIATVTPNEGYKLWDKPALDAAIARLNALTDAK